MLEVFNLIKDIKSKSGEQHFKRWNIISIPWFRIYIHEISKADEDEHLHNHPWNFISIILKGGYLEEWLENNNSYKINYRAKEYGRFRPILRWAKDFHKIKKVISPTYTLVFAFGKRRSWGFNVLGFTISNESYRKIKHG